MFPSLSPGEYKLVPYYIGAQTKFDVQPPELSFKVNHSSILLRQGFKVTGFTVSGIVRTAINGDPLPGAKVLLSQKQIVITNEHGRYVLDNIKAGQYILKAESGTPSLSSILSAENANFSYLFCVSFSITLRGLTVQ